MIIAVNTRVLPDDYPDEYREFAYETFKRIAGNNPQHKFIFISNRKEDHQFIIGENVKWVAAGPVAKHPLLWKIWYNIKVPAVLQKFKADIFISCDGICSLTTKTPQCLVLHDLFFSDRVSFLKKSHWQFYKKNTAKFLRKAKKVVAVSEFLKQEIISQYKTVAREIDVVPYGVDELFQPAAEEVKVSVKDKYTARKENFIYSGAIHPAKNLLNLLKAFSVFKKRQQTNMKLVLAGKLALNYQSFKKNLASYKYRSDVVMIEDVDKGELIKIMGAAYGLVCPCVAEGFAVQVLQAMQCDVPVITVAGSSMQEITNGAALYADANSYTDIADKMMLLYKNENCRNELIQKGRPIAQKYNWDTTAELLWGSILTTIN
jgi:glycosyltransferase involved in cell wall biosynthesis